MAPRATTTGSSSSTARRLAFQRVVRLERTTWPEDGVPMQMHLRLDRTDDPDEPLYALIDPSGHPFCIFVA